MARRRSKDKSIIEVALNSGWQFSAILATSVLIATLLVPLLVSNQYLKPLLHNLAPLGFIVAGLFYLIALFRFLNRKPNLFNQFSDNRKEPLLTPLEGDLAFNKTFQIKPFDFSSPETTPPLWSLKLVQDLEWKRFEELCVAYYNEKGIRAEATDLGADGGIDIKLYQDGTSNPTSIAQCKAWGSKVGVKQVREFLGVMTHEKITKGFYMTSNGFTEEAKGLAQVNNVTLISGEMLLMMIGRLSKASQDKLIFLATKGDYKSPSCPSCGVKMVRRSGGIKKFWGCVNFPRCRQTLKLRAVDA